MDTVFSSPQSIDFAGIVRAFECYKEPSTGIETVLHHPDNDAPLIIFVRIPVEAAVPVLPRILRNGWYHFVRALSVSEEVTSVVQIKRWPVKYRRMCRCFKFFVLTWQPSLNEETLIYHRAAVKSAVQTNSNEVPRCEAFLGKLCGDFSQRIEGFEYRILVSFNSLIRLFWPRHYIQIARGDHN